MVELAFAGQQGDGDRQGQQLRASDGQPDAVHPQERGKGKNSDNLKNQGAQERDQSRGQAVVEGGEKRGAENGKSAEQEGNRENGKSA